MDPVVIHSGAEEEAEDWTPHFDLESFSPKKRTPTLLYLGVSKS
jgi:hypothetical protein